MSRTPFLSLALAGLALLCVGVRADTTDDLNRLTPVPANMPIPLVDFFRPDLIRDPQLNDAGTCFAATLTDAKNNAFGLLVEHLDTHKVETLGGPISYHWLDDDHLMCQVAMENATLFGTIVAPVGHLQDGYYLDRHIFLNPLGIPRDDRMDPLIWLRYSFNGFGGGSEVGVMSINAKVHLPSLDRLPGGPSTDSGTGLRATVGHAYPIPHGGIQSGYLCDKMGHLAFATTESGGRFTLYRLSGDQWLNCPVDMDRIEVLGVGDKAGELIVLGPRESGRPRAVQRMDAATGELGEVLYRDTQYDPETATLYRHPVTRQIIGMNFVREADTTVWFLKEYQALQHRIERSLPMKNVVVTILGSSMDQRRFVVGVRSDVLPVSYYQIDLEKGTLGLIKSTRPWIDPARMHHTQVLSYKTRDGHRIEGYLTLPTGASKAHPVALVVVPHDGPQTRDAWKWDAEAQFLAARGYAVFQPNFRGSLDYRWQFPQFEEWRFEHMPDDLIDGVKLLLRTGLVDKNRIAAMGTGFGAYLALRCMEEEPSLFRCGVLMSGIYDWSKYMDLADREFSSAVDFDVMKRHLGDPKQDPKKFEAMSALRQIDKLKAPVLVTYYNFMEVQGKQALALLSALDRHHELYEKVVVGDELRTINFKRQLKTYAGVEAFLAKHLAPQESK